MMVKAFRIAALLLALCWVVALALFFIGTFGLFGQEATPLAAVFLIPLGLPWTILFGDLADWVGPPLVILAPLLNIAILVGLAELVGRINR